MSRCKKALRCFVLFPSLCILTANLSSSLFSVCIRRRFRHRIPNWWRSSMVCGPIRSVKANQTVFFTMKECMHTPFCTSIYSNHASRLFSPGNFLSRSVRSKTRMTLAHKLANWQRRTTDWVGKTIVVSKQRLRETWEDKVALSGNVPRGISWTHWEKLGLRERKSAHVTAIAVRVNEWVRERKGMLPRLKPWLAGIIIFSLILDCGLFHRAPHIVNQMINDPLQPSRMCRHMEKNLGETK